MAAVVPVSDATVELVVAVTLEAPGGTTRPMTRLEFEHVLRLSLKHIHGLVGEATMPFSVTSFEESASDPSSTRRTVGTGTVSVGRPHLVPVRAAFTLCFEHNGMACRIDCES